MHTVECERVATVVASSADGDPGVAGYVPGYVACLAPSVPIDCQFAYSSCEVAAASQLLLATRYSGDTDSVIVRAAAGSDT
jgi:hypothetical protein